jgi:hypothetical protein
MSNSNRAVWTSTDSAREEIGVKTRQFVKGPETPDQSQFGKTKSTVAGTNSVIPWGTERVTWRDLEEVPADRRSYKSVLNPLVAEFTPKGGTRTSVSVSTI